MTPRCAAYRAPQRRSVADEDWGAHFDLRIQFDHVRDRHPDAAVGACRTERFDLIGAMDSGAFEDPHPARLDRVLRARGDRLPGEVAGPGGVRHVPGRVDFLFLNFVEAFGRFQPFHPHGDRVFLGQLQVLPEAEGEGAAVEGQVGRVLGGDLALGDLRLDGVNTGGNPVRRVRVQHGVFKLLLQEVVAQLAPVLPGDDLERIEARFDVGVLRFPIDFLGDMADEPVDRRLRIGDLRRDLFVDFAAGDVADEAARQAAFLARFDRFFYSGVDIGPDLQLLAGKLPCPAVEADEERMAQRRQQLGADGRDGFFFVHATDVDPGDGDAVGDLVLLRAVIGIGAGDRYHENGGRGQQCYRRSLPHLDWNRSPRTFNRLPRV